MSDLRLRLLQEVANQAKYGQDFIPNFLLSFQGDSVEISKAWSELEHAGLIVNSMKPPPGYSRAAGSYHWYITKEGLAFLQHLQQNPSPNDPEGFLRELRKDPNLSDFVDAAVSEALWAYNANHPIAAIMCLFAAVEAVVRDVDQKTAQPSGDFSISKLFTSLEQRMGPHKNRNTAVQSFLSASFGAIRDARNNASHKTASPDMNIIRLILLQFLLWYKAAAQLRDNPIV